MQHDVLLFLLSLAVLLAVGRLAGEAVRRFGAPGVVGEILAGVVLGKTLLGRLAPSAYEWLFPTGAPKTLLSGYTTVAATLLLVVAGLEIDLNVVRRSSRSVLLTSALGVVVPFALGFGVGELLPASDLADPSKRTLHAAFLGIALSISALPVIARTLLDMGLLKTDIGLIVISAAVFDDIAGWIGFSVLSREFVGGGGNVARIGLSVGLTVVFVAVALALIRPFADWILARVQAQQDRATGRVLTMVVVFALLGASATEALGMHAAFGGFVMGLAIGDSSRLREHTRKVLEDFVTSVFTPVFFATMALRVDFANAFDVRLIAIVLAVACVAKVVGCSLGARLGGVGWKESLAIAFGMNSRGAMEILLAGLALEARIISVQVFVALVVMAVVTSLVSGPIMSRILRAAPSPVLRMLREGVVAIDVPGTSAEVLTELSGRLADRLGRPADAARIAQAVLKREELAGTAIGEGLATPHAEVEGLTAPALGFARTKRELDFNAPDGKPVRLVFVLLIPPRHFQRELDTLAAIVRLVMHESVRRGLLEAPDEESVLAALEQADRTHTMPRSTGRRSLLPEPPASTVR